MANWVRTAATKGAKPACAGWMQPGKDFLIMLYVLLRLLSRGDFRGAGKNLKRKGAGSAVYWAAFYTGPKVASNLNESLPEREARW
jgi:hypothetical protein